jgi:hypothetical protein
MEFVFQVGIFSFCYSSLFPVIRVYFKRGLLLRRLHRRNQEVLNVTSRLHHSIADAFKAGDGGIRLWENIFSAGADFG